MIQWLTVDTTRACMTSGWWILPAMILGGCIWALTILALV